MQQAAKDRWENEGGKPALPEPRQETLKVKETPLPRPCEMDTSGKTPREGREE